MGCVVNGGTYQHLETIPGSHPCDLCRCYNGDVACIWKTCKGAPEYECVPLYVPGTCCPVYTCANSETSLLPQENESGDDEEEEEEKEEAHRTASKGGLEKISYNRTEVVPQ